MRKITFGIVIMVILTLLAGCAQSASAAELKSDKPRQTAPAVSADEAAVLANHNTNFALNLYTLLSDQEGNLFFSPYSISEALAMTYGGARSNTAAEMAAALQFSLDQDKLHAAFNSTDIALAARGEGAQGQDEQGFRLNVVNAVWGQKGFKFTDEYLDLLALNYGAGMRIVDYKTAPEESRQTINQWVADQTENKILDLLPSGSITELTRLVLTNAVYFNAAWAARFETGQTETGQFNLIDGSSVEIPMMQQNAKNYPYVKGDGYQAIELPYEGRELSMLILLPEAGQFSRFESELTHTALEGISDSLQNAAVDLTLPKFKVETELNLVQSLKQLGMSDAFDPDRADFSGMDGKKDLYVSGVVHKAYVSVDENGTEAAAATGVMIGTTAMPIDIQQMRIDRPFIFLIRDNPTGTVLFLGRVMNPTE